MSTRQTDVSPAANPYVGPRTFRRQDADRFFGREREARELLSFIRAKRLVLFYAQSGAGKSSLINARIIPALEQEGYEVLPVGRVSGSLSASARGGNVFVHNLAASLDEEGADPKRFQSLSLADFLLNLSQVDGSYGYHPDAPPPAPELLERGEISLHRVLIIDQFEEILTTNLQAWQQRAAFFDQLAAAMAADPFLRVVLVMREDHVAGLDPFGHRLPTGLRTRYYMERMKQSQALAAVTRPAQAFGRPFAPGVAEKLVDNLRAIQTGQEEPSSATLGEYVEPVQLQVVCFQLWAQLGEETGNEIGEVDLLRLTGGRPLSTFVTQALSDFYERVLQEVLATPQVQAAGVSERALRHWFSQNLITEAGTRGFVHQGATHTAGMPNVVLQMLRDKFLIRAEARAGSVWYELIHDRFVEPIREANLRWLADYDNPLARATEAWLNAGRDPEKLASAALLRQVRTFAASHPNDVTEEEQVFLQESERQAEEQRREAERQARRRRNLFLAGALVVVLLTIAAIVAGRSAIAAREQADLARTAEAHAQAQATVASAAQQTAEANVDLAQQQLAQLAVERLLQESRELKAAGDAAGAIAKLQAVATASPAAINDLDTAIADVRRDVATQIVRTGERLAAGGDYPAASEHFREAFALDPPADTPLYVWIPAGEFTMGSQAADIDLILPLCLKEESNCQRDWFNDEFPQHQVSLDGFWIARTEVTNGQYSRCVAAGDCTEPTNERWYAPQFANQPVTAVTWFQANDYARWMGGRLPTEAEWEKACRGPEARLYPWGNELPSLDRVNYISSNLGTWTDVGSYPPGANGLYDMAGNAAEWTQSKSAPYPYRSDDGREQIDDSRDARIVRGGSFFYGGYFNDVRCTDRNRINPYDAHTDVGFRIAIPGP